MKPLLIFVYLLTFCVATAQNKKQVIKVSYDQYRNGAKTDKSDISLMYHDGVAYLSKASDQIRQYVDYSNRQTVSIIAYEEELFKNTIPFDSLPKATNHGQKDTILGYVCQYATLSSFSNNIEVWYTEESKAKGSPYSKYIPGNKSLILKILINGNYMLMASAIEKETNSSLDFPVKEAQEITSAKLEELKIKSRFTTFNIFKEETINFWGDPTVPTREEMKLGHTYHVSHGTIILKKVTLPADFSDAAYLFAQLTCRSNGDAYDRTGSVFIIPSSDKALSMIDAFSQGIDKVPVYKDNMNNEYQGILTQSNYEPPIEILRFFTSFGVGHFNNLRPINNYPWKNDVMYNQEVTALIPRQQQELLIGIFIGNYDKGGHTVSLDLHAYPGFKKEKQAEQFVKPLFNTVNIMEMSGQNYGRMFKNDTLKVDFEIPDGLKNMKLCYTSTGHGGWGNGDEFNPKLNQIYLDGQKLFSIVPWRTDCATYRLSNPASGNFGNGLSSSDLSRSNWCPGTLTPPYIIPLDSLKKGKHKLEIIIDQGDDEGSSFNHWSTSGVLVGEKREE